MRKYGDAGGYDTYMGSWSAALSPPFLDFLGLHGPTSVVDVGCGTGNLLVAVAARHANAELIGVDPSHALLEKARTRPELASAKLLEGFVESLPLEAQVAHATLSMLVLQEFSDRATALAEMRRVTRPGGLVAGCQWDFARMPIIAALVDAIETVNPEAGKEIWAHSPPVFNNEEELKAAWLQAGFNRRRTARLSVERVFPTFQNLWLPLLAGSTPSTLALASLSPADRQAVQDIVAERLCAKDADPVGVIAEAFVVAGTV